MDSIGQSALVSKWKTTLLPIVFLLLGSSLWGIFWYPLRLLEQHGLGGLWASFLIYAAALAVGLPLLWRGRQDFRRQPLLLALLALATGWCNTTFILAVLEGPVVRVLLLFYLSPVWTVLFARLILREHLTPLAGFTVVMAMTGAVIILWDPAIGLAWPQERADVWAISSGLAFALANVLVRRSQDIAIPSKMASTWLGVTVLAGVWLGVTGAQLPEVSAQVVMAALMIGMVGIVLMTGLVVYGVTHMPAHRSAVLMLFEVVAGAVSVQLLADEAILPKEWLGGMLVMLAAWLAARQQWGN